jgi:fatty acid desaturase
MSAKPATLPSLSDLGRDLCTTTAGQRALALSRPYLGVAAFAGAASLRWWWALPLVVFAIFVAVVTVTHDVVHGSLGLGRRAGEWALFLLGAVLMESGHAYRATHLQHHRLFPHPDDPEGYPARLGMVGAVCYGPVFLARLWWWAFGRAAGRPALRLVLLAEAAVPVAGLAGGVLLWPLTPAPLLYATMVIVGSWVYPLLTVYLPHHDPGDTPLTQTRTLRGRLIPAVFLELTYHLEHHLYPQVPSHQLAELGRRLDPYFTRLGVTPRRVP